MQRKRVTFRSIAVLAAVGSLALTACGGSSGGSSAGGGGSSSGVIKIGAAEILSGPFFINDQFSLGLNYTVAQINAKGGVDGKKVELDVHDIGSTAATTLTAGQQFVYDKVNAVVGISITFQDLAVVPLFTRDKIISLLGVPSLADSYTATHDAYNFQFDVPDNETIAHQVSFAINTLHAKRFAMLLDTTSYGQTFGQLAAPQIQAEGGQLVATQSVNSDANDVSTQVTKLLAAKPDVIMVAVLTPEVGVLFYRELKELGGANPPKVMAAAAIMASLGTAIPWTVAQGTYGTSMIQGVSDPPQRPGYTAPFYQALVPSKASPEETVAQLHDAILAYVSAVAATGGTDPTKIDAYFAKLTNFTGWNGIKTIGGPYNCTASTHFCQHTQYMGEVQGSGITDVQSFSS